MTDRCCGWCCCCSFPIIVIAGFDVDHVFDLVCPCSTVFVSIPQRPLKTASFFLQMLVKKHVFLVAIELQNWGAFLL